MAERWGTVGTDFNRFVQKYRRLHNVQVQYIRTVEAHLDSYPHIHIIFQFDYARISVNNARYFDNVLYAKWKKLWTFGLSDYQPPRNQQFPILYLIKYISKNSHTHKTLWKKLYADNVDVVTSKIPISTISPAQNIDASASIMKDPKHLSTDIFCKKYKIKQCSWSRKFVFPRLPKGGSGGTPDILKYAED